MKKLCKNLFRIILLCISSPSFASSTMWTAATFASHGVRGFTDPGDISPASIAAMAATGANVLRYFVVFEPNTGNSSATSYTWNSTLLSDVVSSATANGLKVIIVLSPDSTSMPRGYLWGVGDTSLHKRIASRQVLLLSGNPLQVLIMVILQLRHMIYILSE